MVFNKVQLTGSDACSLVTIVLAGAGVLAQPPRPPPSDRFNGIDPTPSNVPPTRVSGPNDGGGIRVVARVECSADAQASAFSGFVDAFASACVSPPRMLSWNCPGALSCM